MKNTFIKLLVALFTALSFNTIQSHFVTGSIWYKDDAQGERHYVYLLGDAHQINRLGLELYSLGEKLENQKKTTLDDIKKLIKMICKVKDLCGIEDKQVEALCKHVSSCGASDTVIMLENVSPTNEKEQEATDTLLLEKPFKKSIFDRINDQLAPTHAIVILEKRKFISHTTIKDYAAGDLLLDKNLTREKAKKIALEAKQEAESFLDSILTTSHNNQLKEFCVKTKTKLIDDFNELTRLIDTHAQDFNWLEKLVGRYLSTQKSAGQEMFKGLILNLDMSILDASILSSITTHEAKKHIYVCAGAEHIHNIERELDTYGYKMFDQSYISPTFTSELKDIFLLKLPRYQHTYGGSNWESYWNIHKKIKETDDVVGLNVPALNVTDFFAQAHHAQPPQKSVKVGALITAAALYGSAIGIPAYALWNMKNPSFPSLLLGGLSGFIGSAGLGDCLARASLSK